MDGAIRRGGEGGREEEGEEAMNRKQDSKDIRSKNFPGCPPGKEAQFRHEYAKRGVDVRFERGTGDAIFATRRDKLKALKITGLHDKNEIRG